jgi:hypothetical protein
MISILRRRGYSKSRQPPEADFHRRMWSALAGGAIVMGVTLLVASTAQGEDVDLDGIPDDQDNCIVLGGLTFQTDTDGDGFGNACDPDYDQDGFVLGSDIEIIYTQFGGYDPVFDHTNDGFILGDDVAFLFSLFNHFPFAVSGLPCADPTHDSSVDPPCLP